VWRTITTARCRRSSCRIALVRHLARVADIDPGVREEMFHLELEQLLVDVGVLMHFEVAHEPRTAAGSLCSGPSWSPPASFLVCGFLDSSTSAASSRAMQIGSACLRPSPSPSGNSRGDPARLRAPSPSTRRIAALAVDQRVAAGFFHHFGDRLVGGHVSTRRTAQLEFERPSPATGAAVARARNARFAGQPRVFAPTIALDHAFGPQT